MTENTTATTDTTEPADATTTDAGATEHTENGPNREAAKYRTRLREAEAERDTLREAVTALQRAEVERIAADRLSNPAGLWAAGVDMATLLTDQGTIDPAKVQQAATEAAEALGLASPARAPVVPSEGNIAHPAATDSMVEAIRGW